MPCWVDQIGRAGAFPQHHGGGAGATRRLLEMAALCDGLDVLVVGCGNGGMVFKIAEQHNCRVVGTDINPLAVSEADRARRVKRLKGSACFLTDDLLNSSLPRGGFDRVIIESVLIMLPKEEALAAIHSLLRPGGRLIINEATRAGDESVSLKAVEEEFTRAGIVWSLPTYNEWSGVFVKAGFDVVSDTKPIPFNVALMGLSGFVSSPVKTMAWFFRVLLNTDARRFFRRVFTAMKKSRLKWAYCLWVCEKT